jgi:hypothetical protein
MRDMRECCVRKSLGGKWGDTKNSEIWQEKAMKMPAPNRVYMYLNIQRGAGGGHRGHWASAG